MASGKLLKISDDLSVFIFQNEDSSYFTTDNVIRYRNIGKSYDIKQILDDNIFIDSDNMLHVMNEGGDDKFYFPAALLDTNFMKLLELKADGLLQIK